MAGTVTVAEMVGWGNEPPAYPEEAIRREWDGTVGLVVSFAPEGGAVAAEVVRSSGHTLLDEAALEAALRWHLPPSPTTRRFHVPVEFVLE